jgi:acyl-CoA dehydrogenase
MMDHIYNTSCVKRAERIGRDIAARYSDDVDREARFPAEAVDALKAEGMLGLMVPREHGGEGASIHDIVAACSALARHCGSTGMIFAMHHVMVASLLAGKEDSRWHADLLRRLATERLLLGSATSENGVGGDIRSSICAIERQRGNAKVEKHGTVISYGRQADGILVSARRAPDAAPSDQVLLVALKSQYELVPTESWDTLGMRGTCSEGFRVRVSVPQGQTCPLPFADIAARSMLPVSHILWSAVWHGIAMDAICRAQDFARTRARKNPKAPLVGIIRLAEAAERMQLLGSNIAGAARAYEEMLDKHGGNDSVRDTVLMNNLKVSCSQLAVEIIGKAMLMCGLAGYRNDSPHSLSRHLRDAYSSLLMVNNDRVEHNVAQLLLMSRIDCGL